MTSLIKWPGSRRWYMQCRRPDVLDREEFHDNQKIALCFLYIPRIAPRIAGRYCCISYSPPMMIEAGQALERAARTGRRASALPSIEERGRRRGQARARGATSCLFSAEDLTRLRPLRLWLTRARARCPSHADHGRPPRGDREPHERRERDPARPALLGQRDRSALRGSRRRGRRNLDRDRFRPLRRRRKLGPAAGVR